MTTPTSLSQSYATCGNPFHCSSVFSAVTHPPDLHWHSALRRFPVPGCVKHLSLLSDTLQKVPESQNHPTSLQVSCSLQHPVLVWLTLLFLLKKKKKEKSRSPHKSLPGSSTNPAPTLCPVQNVVTFGSSCYLE